ncbi:MAG: hypothetical protein HZB92_01560 [Euryarchaeota archaeon]|nr:hypothetical protein [Euryarchaeota archaeon]
MDAVLVLLIAAFITFLVLAFIAIKVPRGRHDWGKDRAETASLVATGLTFLALFLLLWYLSATIEWPAVTTMLFYGGVVLVVSLVIVALIAPDGFKLEFAREKGKE